MLKEGQRALAELVCSRLELSVPSSETSAFFASVGQRLDRIATHIHVLAACIEFSSPLLIKEYAGWAANLRESVSPFYSDIACVLDQLETVVQLQFPTDAAIIVTRYIQIALESIAESQPAIDAPIRINPLLRLQQDYLSSLLAARRDDALHLILEAVDAGVEIEAIYLNVFQPAQEEVGRLWQAGNINVALEHYVTAATQFVMSQLQPYFLTKHSSAKTLVATCVGEELHEVGLRIVSDLFEINGWNTVYLGANTPAKSIAQTLVSNGAQLLAVSTTMTQHLFGVTDVIREVRSHAGCEDVKVLVGGYPFVIDPYLWQRVGADAVAVDGKEAIRIVRRLVDDNDESVRGLRNSSRRIDTVVSMPQLGVNYDDLSRLNNSLITAQRELNKAHVELAAVNKANQAKAEALQQADHRKDEFLAMLAHELRGPLAPMQFAASLLQMDDLNSSVLAEARQTMKRQLHHMERLISGLLDTSRIAHGKIELKKETLDLASVMERAVEFTYPLIQENKQDLIINQTDETLSLNADLIRLIQVLANLLTNASKYTQAGGTIWLSSKRFRDKVVVEVRDNGVGIAAEMLPHVFSSFAQEQRSRERSMGGLGLGLSLVKQLVELHEGSVEAQSEGAGMGSTFTITLPALAVTEKTREPQAAAELSAADEFSISPARSVLVVDDMAGIARMTARLLEKLGHLPVIALDGKSAIKKYQELPQDIVILDLMLPDMSGMQVIRELRQLDVANATLIVVLSGHSDDEHRRIAAESGCDIYLVKPVDVRTLADLATHPKLMTLSRS